MQELNGTKKILILSDGKIGHVKQSLALVEQLKQAAIQSGRAGVNFEIKTVVVRYKSSAHRIAFAGLSLFLIPFSKKIAAQNFFYTNETSKEIPEEKSDMIISAGSSLVPLNLCLARHHHAKTVVLMKPSFPFNLFRYDLAVVPAHDEGAIPQEAFRTMLTLSQVDRSEMQQAAEKLKKELMRPDQIRFGIFLGGATRGFKMNSNDIKKLMDTLNQLASDYLVTTSRRTPDEVDQFLKANQNSHCQLLVIGKEDSRREVVPGMMFLADILIVTEDSVSMISEAVASGKKVIVLSLNSGKLPEKHRRFKEILARESAVVIANLSDLKEKIMEVETRIPVPLVQKETEALRRRLQEIL
jgi:uncharacterized protein